LIVQKQTIASLTLYAEEDDVFVGHELDLVSELAADLALGLTSIRLREQAEENRESRLILEEQYLQSQKMEAIGRLAGGISHDFNNLLMVIMAQTDLLSLQLTGPDLARAQSIMQSVHKAAELTRQLLAFSRKQFVQPNVLSVNHVLMDITRMARHLLSEDIEMTCSSTQAMQCPMAANSRLKRQMRKSLRNTLQPIPWCLLGGTSCWQFPIPESAWTKKPRSAYLNPFLQPRNPARELGSDSPWCTES
jgi:signal transduction histidine kinase